MRLGQWARKFDVTPQEIVDYLKSKGIEANPHPNSKLDDSAEKLVVEHFDILIEDQVEIQSNSETEESTERIEVAELQPIEIIAKKQINVSEEIKTPETASELIGESKSSENSEVANVDIQITEKAPDNNDVAIEAETSENTISEIEEESSEKITKKTITVSDLLENEEESIDFDLVKAPKVSLAGLKVIGKIELPDPKPKTETAPKPQKDKRDYKGRKALSEAEREKRRLRAKKKKQEYEERKKRREEKVAAKKLKAAKEAHYHSKIKEKPESKLKAGKKTPKGKNASAQQNKPIPKTIFGKFWRWLNT